MRGDRDKIRRLKAATSVAMKRAVRTCQSCGRGQNPRKHDVGDGRRIWVCRYCGHEH